MKGYVAEALRLGAVAAKVIDPREVVTGEWVRRKCQYGCGGYRSSLCCPPHSPTPEATRRMLDEYRRAILFEAAIGEPDRIALALERHVFLSGREKAFGMGSGPCELCRSACAFEEGCRHPEKARPSMEASGIDVFSTVRKQGFEIRVLRSTDEEGHYFGLVLVE
ncbi:MAG: DUF2284 domain-containing protein [Planctomycetota bacterium]